MAEPPAPKAVRDGYSPPPFVFEERHESGAVRFVAWSPDIEQMKNVLYAILGDLPDEVEVLFKTETGGESGRGGWQRYSGRVSRALLLESVRATEELVFHDGGSMVCVKRLDNEDYLALDEHATLFVYSHDRSYLHLCERSGFENRVNELISAAGHWQVRPANHEAQERQLIRQLGLVPVP